MRVSTGLFSILRLKAASVCLVFVLLVACDEKCCYFGPLGQHDCGISGSGGECGLVACVSIGVDQTSQACATGTGGYGANFIHNYHHYKSANATYQVTVRYDGILQPPVPPSSITLSPDANIFLGCNHSNGDVSLPTSDATFALVSYSMNSAAAVGVKPTTDATSKNLTPLIDSVVSVREMKPIVGPAKQLNAQVCKTLCDQLDGKCVFLPADSLISVQQQAGLAQLFSLLTKQGVGEIPQAQMLKLFAMMKDPCSRGTTAFTGKQAGQFSNKGGGCSLSLSNSEVLGGTATRWVAIPAELAGTFTRDNQSITLSFDSPQNMASYNTMTSNPEVLTRLTLDQAYAIAGRIVASAGDKCVDFRFAAK